ncbi:MAG: hypothetical protein ACRELC_14800 [Gemmatimonadota bacterium]
MRAFRWGVATMAAVLASLAMAGPASSGGSWIAPERPAYVHGDIAVLRGVFSTGSLEGRLSDGPYYTYLLPRRVWIDRYRVPPSAIRLGELEIVRTSTHGFEARARFVVPAVASGLYHVGYCNDPCTVDGIGDLVGSEFFAVAATRDESLLVLRNERLRQQVERMAHARQRLATKAAHLDEELAAATSLLAAVRDRADQLVDELADARRAVRTERSGNTWAPAALASGLAAVLIAVVVLQARSRRRARLDAEIEALTRDERVPARR